MALSRCCTQVGDAAAAGLMTCGAIPSGIEDCPWRTPSKIQMSPKETRSKRRATGSQKGTNEEGAGAPVPRVVILSCAERSRFQNTPTTKRISRTINAW